MTEHIPSRSAWWRLVEEYLEALDHDERSEPLLQPSDPWAHSHPEAPGLTPEQRALLAGDDDQPGVARFAHPDGGPDDQPSVPRLAHPAVEDSDDGAEERDPPGR